MREAVNADRLQQFMRLLAKLSNAQGRVYLVGGATAVLLKWRESTLDVDINIFPEDDRILRVLPELKERLDINVELASPADFIPPLPGWQDRSAFVAQEGNLFFHHYDFYAQCLAKIERGHRKDVKDVRAMIELGLVTPSGLRKMFAEIEPMLYKYPAIDPATFRDAVMAVTGLG
ncbi:MAG TPA: DUF6036 family nucleotidyltransferase [Thermoanaerobaculia bacterium]|nr:DUF6036 family nucleotidyltransferase [Thermoanaerobaculia bacterium]